MKLRNPLKSDKKSLKQRFSLFYSLPYLHHLSHCAVPEPAPGLAHSHNMCRFPDECVTVKLYHQQSVCHHGSTRDLHWILGLGLKVKVIIFCFLNRNYRYIYQHNSVWSIARGTTRCHAAKQNKLSYKYIFVSQNF